MVIVHGDRVEALAGAIVGSLNNTLVSHIEGGEISGTIDELIRHSVSKLSHLHFVANHKAKERLKQLGELDSLIHVIGSPDLDLMNSNKLPDISIAKQYYGVDYESYAIAMYHPVTTEIEKIEDNVTNYINALCESNLNYIVIYPNNDLGSKLIIDAINKNKDNQKMKIFPSLRFEYFLTLLKNANFIIGNSSAGVREAPYYGIKTIDVGSRQNNRSSAETIINCGDTKNEIIDAIRSVSKNTKSNVSKNYSEFGSGQSDKKFIEILDSKLSGKRLAKNSFKILPNMSKKRVIARIDVKNEYAIKGIHLEGLRKVGDPNTLALKYYNSGIDEILFMDAVASYYDRNSLNNVISKASNDIFVPITVGGGIRKIKDIQNALNSGADKVSINTQCIKTLNL